MGTMETRESVRKRDRGGDGGGEEERSRLRPSTDKDERGVHWARFRSKGREHQRDCDVLCIGAVGQEAVAVKTEVGGITVRETVVLNTVVVEIVAVSAAAETGAVETRAMKTAAVDTAAVGTAAVDTVAVETGTVETAAVETARVETPTVETAGVKTATVETAVAANDTVAIPQASEDVNCPRCQQGFVEEVEAGHARHTPPTGRPDGGGIFGPFFGAPLGGGGVEVTVSSTGGADLSEVGGPGGGGGSASSGATPAGSSGSGSAEPSPSGAGGSEFGATAGGPAHRHHQTYTVRGNQSAMQMLEAVHQMFLQMNRGAAAGGLAPRNPSAFAPGLSPFIDDASLFLGPGMLPGAGIVAGAGPGAGAAVAGGAAGGMDGGAAFPGNPHMYLQAFLGNPLELVFDNTAGVVGGRRLGGNIGDYFIGPGLEQLIQHLAENDPNRYGTPPASRKAVEELKKVTITKERLDDDDGGAVCAVCKDAFEMGSEVREMPCRHLYHDDCIMPWLRDHNSCPVCRYELETDDPEYNRTRLGTAGGARHQHVNNNSRVGAAAGGGGGSGGGGGVGIGIGAPHGGGGGTLRFRVGRSGPGRVVNVVGGVGGVAGSGSGVGGLWGETESTRAGSGGGRGSTVAAAAGEGSSAGTGGAATDVSTSAGAPSSAGDGVDGSLGSGSAPRSAPRVGGGGWTSAIFNLFGGALGGSSEESASAVPVGGGSGSSGDIGRTAGEIGIRGGVAGTAPPSAAAAAAAGASGLPSDELRATGAASSMERNRTSGSREDADGAGLGRRVGGGRGRGGSGDVDAGGDTRMRDVGPD
ncbi:hypothetical protein CBR_g36486 [Chara braunii]|uniref:RING-type E3 ubiquitin transferase n=1 Tax=Chara braunii TaxID=69332 RepID=A0A388LKV9_CHABU|nr:hypothetical protein CBR_g36486 [Chara braunii]|eukprot:GBG82960.1 hypothetical protein CBR_g36486 [Chara braunii]